MGKTDPERNLLQEMREHKRVSVSWDARIRHGQTEEGGQILDVSLTGVGIQLENDLEPGIDLEIDIPGIGVLKGRVVWSMSGRSGVLFSSNPDKIRTTLFSRARLDEEAGCDSPRKNS